MMKKYDVIVLGGCASGLSAAINCARNHPDYRIAVCEKLPRVGKKILATGNGRCNLSNRSAVNHSYTNIDFASSALKKYDVDAVLDFFSSLGLLTYDDEEGRIYPLSNTAASVLDALRLECSEIADIFTDTPVTSVVAENGGFTVNGTLFGDRVIVALGGKASPSQGSDGSGYDIARSFGHGITPLYPSLVPLIAKGNDTKPLKGVRIHSAKLTVFSGSSAIASSEGEVLFTDNGISGIAAMELASSVEKALAVKARCFTSIDFLPGMNHKERVNCISSLCSHSARDCDTLLTGLMPKAAGIAVLQRAGIDTGKAQPKNFTKSDIESIALTSSDFRLEMKSTRGFDSAQVTCGGVDVSEINPETMESLLCKGLYFAGEIIDVDGGCGGFNLQWAWSSGLLAGEVGG